MSFTEFQLDEFGARINLGQGRIPIFLDDYLSFVDNNYPLILNFFSGNSTVLENDNIIILFELIDRANIISNNITLFGFQFDNYLYWEIAEFLESMKVELWRISKTHKFLRSSKTNINFTSNLELPMMMEQNQTLEDVAFGLQQDNNYGNSWIDLAFRNGLSEIDYTLDGKEIIVGFRISSRNYSIRSVIDTIIGEKILGLDLQRLLKFEDDDLKVLSYNETALQSVEILVNLMKGDVPEFKSFGRTKFIGTSTVGVGLATIIREMYTVFSSDDTLTRFSVKEYRQEGSSAFLKYEVSTRLGETTTQSTTLQ